MGAGVGGNSCQPRGWGDRSYMASARWAGLKACGSLREKWVKKRWVAGWN